MYDFFKVHLSGRPFRLLSPATKNLAMLQFPNPQRLKSLGVISEECGGHAVGPARNLHLSGNTIWGLVHTRIKNVVKSAMLLKNQAIIIVILYLWHQVDFQNHRSRETADFQIKICPCTRCEGV